MIGDKSNVDPTREKKREEQQKKTRRNEALRHPRTVILFILTITIGIMYIIEIPVHEKLEQVWFLMMGTTLGENYYAGLLPIKK